MLQASDFRVHRHPILRGCVSWVGRGRSFLGGWGRRGVAGEALGFWRGIGGPGGGWYFAIARFGARGGIRASAGGRGVEGFRGVEGGSGRRHERKAGSPRVWRMRDRVRHMRVGVVLWVVRVRRSQRARWLVAGHEGALRAGGRGVRRVQQAGGRRSRLAGAANMPRWRRRGFELSGGFTNGRHGSSFIARVKMGFWALCLPSSEYSFV